MTEDAGNKNSPIRLSPAVREEIDRELGARQMRGQKTTYGRLLEEVWIFYKSRSEPAAPPKGLSEDQRDVLAILAMRDAPPGPLRLLQDAALFALPEYREKYKPKAKPKTSRSRADDERDPTGT